MQARYYDPLIGRFLSIDPVGFSPDMPFMFGRYTYVGNDPVNGIDPDGRILGKAIKFIRNTIKAGGNPLKGGKDTIAGAAEDIGTLVDGQLNADDAAAVVSLVTGLDKKDQAAIKGAAKNVKNKLPKPPTGKGSVPKSERDPKRTFSPDERAAKRQEQGGQCANGCGTEIDTSNSQGHHIERHADGGPTTPDNHAEVCIDCHKELHSPD